MALKETRRYSYQHRPTCIHTQFPENLIGIPVTVSTARVVPIISSSKYVQHFQVSHLPSLTRTTDTWKRKRPQNPSRLRQSRAPICSVSDTETCKSKSRVKTSALWARFPLTAWFWLVRSGRASSLIL